MIDAFLYVFSITNIFLFHCLSVCLSVWVSASVCVCLFAMVIKWYIRLCLCSLWIFTCRSSTANCRVRRCFACVAPFPYPFYCLSFKEHTAIETEGERLEGYFTHQKQNKSIKRKCKLHRVAHCTFHVLSYPYTPTSIPVGATPLTFYKTFNCYCCTWVETVLYVIEKGLPDIL